MQAILTPGGLKEFQDSWQSVTMTTGSLKYPMSTVPSTQSSRRTCYSCNSSLKRSTVSSPIPTSTWAVMKSNSIAGKNQIPGKSRLSVVYAACCFRDKTGGDIRTLRSLWLPTDGEMIMVSSSSISSTLWWTWRNKSLGIECVMSSGKNVRLSFSSFIHHDLQ